MDAPGGERVALITVAREWTRIGCIGFGGPPTHIALLRRLCVEDRRWLSASEFEDGLAATNLLPGPRIRDRLRSVVRLRHRRRPELWPTTRQPTRSDLSDRAGPAAIGAIAGAAIPLARAISEWWQLGVLGLAAAWLLGLRRGVVTTLIGAEALGVFAALIGAPVG